MVTSLEHVITARCHILGEVFDRFGVAGRHQGTVREAQNMPPLARTS
jgi:hypothetical protein